MARKQIFLARIAREARQEKIAEFLLSLKAGTAEPISSIIWDEMETFEHSKCLPVSIPLVVLPKSRKILGFGVAQMPAKGPLAEISRKKYGIRADERAQVVKRLFKELSPILSLSVEVTSDQNPKYPGWVKSVLPSSKLTAHKGRRGCVVGQGELKRGGFDPLFDLNHTCAMLRANISRLVRRTWATTKRRDRLADHIEIYIDYHNSILT